MDRRKFLKAMAAMPALPAGAAAIGDELDAYPAFDRSQIYGGIVTIDCWDGAHAALAEGYDYFAPLIADEIPPSFRWNIRWVVLEPRMTLGDPMGMRGKVGWRYPRFSPGEGVVFVRDNPRG